MSDKKILAILALLALYVFMVKPLSEKIYLKKFELKNIEKAIVKEKFINKKSSEIKKIYPLQIKTISNNKKLLFSSKISTSSAMSKMQEILNNMAKKNNIKITGMNWAEAIDKGGYLKLPITFLAKGNPEDISSFIKDITSSDKLFRFKMFSISRNNNALSINTTVECFKMKGDKEKHK